MADDRQSPYSRRRFALNSISFSAVRLVTGSGNLVVWPYVVVHVGFTAYGAWVLISSALQYIILLDMSLGIAFVRQVANRSADDYLSHVNAAARALTLVEQFVAPPLVLRAPVLLWVQRPWRL